MTSRPRTPGSLPPGTIDVHVHTAPDRDERRVDDIDLASTGPADGLAGAVLKCHDEPTAGRARLARRVAPGFAAFGSVVLNHAVGGLEPRAVEALAAVGRGTARIVWLPTRDAENDIAQKGRAGPPVRVTEAGRPTRAVLDVARAAADHGLVLASGHLAPAETLAVFAAAAPLDGRLLATHVTARVTRFSRDDLVALLPTGAYVELCARNLLEPRPDEARMREDEVAQAVEVVRVCGIDRVVLSSDLGDPRYPAPADGLRAAAEALSRHGIGDAGLEALLLINPRRLLAPWNASSEEVGG